MTSAHIDWDFLDEHYQTTIFHQFLKVAQEDRLDSPLFQNDVSYGSKSPVEHPANTPRNSAPRTGEAFAEHRQKRTSTKKPPTPGSESGRRTADSFGSDRSSVERLVKHLMDDLQAIHVTDSGTIHPGSLTVPNDKLGESVDIFPLKY